MTHPDANPPVTEDKLPLIEEERQRVLLQERELWQQVKGKHPGQPGYDGDAWNKWQALANRVQELDAQLKIAEPKGYRRR